MELVNLKELATANVVRGASIIDTSNVCGIYTAECIGPDGEIKWTDTAKNLVTTQGKTYLFNTGFRGTAAIGAASWFVGLKKTTAGGADADTIATHAGWTEAIPATDYTANRKAFTFNAPTGTTTVSTTGSAVSFAILTTFTAYGCILVSVATGGTGTDILYSVSADFGTPKAVSNGDTLNITYTTQM